MRSSNVAKRLLSLFLVLCMVCAWVLPASAHESGISVTQVSNDRVSANLIGKDPVQLEDQEPQYADDEIVRVSIFLERASVLDAGFAVQGLAVNQAAMAYRAELKEEQISVASRIEKVIKGELDVAWNLTLVTNLISANVEFGQIEAIEKVKGVREVVIETRYEPDVVSSAPADPNMATSGVQTGTLPSYAMGYTGAGSRIAIIDTGLDIDHLSFNAAAYEYSLSLLAEKAEMTVEEYVASLNLLDVEEIASVLGQLHIGALVESAEHLYINSKLPFGFNYVDVNTNVTHLDDSQGEHGSHVAGIATANAYVPAENGFAEALKEVYVQGVAPDAQLMVMKVFGAEGGAYEADYMAAIEDAIVLGADSINLSLGSGNPGMSRNSTAAYQAIFDGLERCDVVVSISAGNAYQWPIMSETGASYLYADDVSMQTNGSPGSFTNSLSVASVNNAGYVTTYVTVAGQNISYIESRVGNDGTPYKNEPFTTLGGAQEFVFLNGIGTEEQFAALGAELLTGKIALCYRGETSFFEKAEAAVKNGAIGVIIVNNQSGSILMDLSDYTFTAPVVSIAQVDGEAFKLNPVSDETTGTVLYWSGTMTVSESADAFLYPDAYYTMSSFSSWGVPGSLELKPEITAPGGEILSVGGANASSDNPIYDHETYEVMSGTSMAAPQVAGMAALLAQYIRENGLAEKTGLDARTLSQSLLMSTAVPILESANGYYSILKQGAGLANVGAAMMADTYILMGEDATASYADGKVKVELGDDPGRTGKYTFSFTINNMDNAEKLYNLSADFFIQAPYSGLMHTSTALIGALSTFTVNGEEVSAIWGMDGMDFNGDGVVNALDGQTLLDYAAGKITELTNADLADLNEDGVINSYDAYLFLADAEAVVTVPASGNVEVQVEIEIPAEWQEYIEYFYPNGTYIQGFVYADGVGSEEGVVGTSHSIPVLGFYGNWSDPSMFDKIDYEDLLTGTASRAPYLYETNYKNGLVNGLYVTYADDPSNSYYFGGNPIDPYEAYKPERNAIGNAAMINKIGFTAIRNAAATCFQVIDWTNEELLIDENLGVCSSAYYAVSAGAWKANYWTVPTNLDLTDVADDTLLEIGLWLIPEYYVDAEGNVNWAALGKGTTLSMTMTVDNTAPVLETVEIDEENNTLKVKVTDNQYVAAVALLDEFGEYTYVMEGSKADAEAGDTCEYALDLTDVNGAKFLLQVYDYAMNCVTYEIKTQIGEVVDEVTKITISDTNIMLAKGTAKQLSATVLPINAANRNVVWMSTDETVATVENGKVVAVGAGTAYIVATAEANEEVYAACVVTVVELDVTLSGVLQDVDGTPVLFSWDLANDSTWTTVAGLDLPMASVAYDSYYKVLLGQSGYDGYMYIIDPATGEIGRISTGACALGDVVDDMAVSLCFGTANGSLLYGIYGSYLLTSNSPVENSFLSGWNLANYMRAYTGGTKLVAVTDYSYTEKNGNYVDVILALDDAGYLWQLTMDLYTGSIGLSYIPTDLDLTYPTTSSGMQCCSMICDATGNLYLSYFTGSTNEIYYLAYSAALRGFTSMLLGDVGADVWPVALFGAQANAEAAEPSAATGIFEEVMSVAQLNVTAEMQEINLADLTKPENPVLPMSGAILDAEDNSATVAITAKDVNGENVESNNGVITVSYDPSVQTLKLVTVHGDYYSLVDNGAGTITFAYVNVDGFKADDVVATLIFDVIDEAAAGVVVEYKEINDVADVGTEEKVEADSLMQALENLAAAIAAGDKALDDKISALDEALKSAIEACENADASLRGELAAQIASANTTLQAMVSQVAANLETAKSDLADAIAAGDADLGQKIADLNVALDDMSAAYKVADRNLKNSLTELIQESEATLQSAIEKVAADLVAAEKALSDAIAAGDKDLDQKIAALNEALNAALENVSISSDELKADMAGAVATLNAAIAQVQKNLDDAKAELSAKDNELTAKADELAAQAAQLNTLVTVAIVVAVVALGAAVAVAFVVIKKKH